MCKCIHGIQQNSHWQITKELKYKDYEYMKVIQNQTILKRRFNTDEGPTENRSVKKLFKS